MHNNTKRSTESNLVPRVSLLLLLLPEARGDGKKRDPGDEVVKSHVNNNNNNNNNRLYLKRVKHLTVVLRH